MIVQSEVEQQQQKAAEKLVNATKHLTTWLANRDYAVALLADSQQKLVQARGEVEDAERMIQEARKELGLR